MTLVLMKQSNIVWKGKKKMNKSTLIEELVAVTEK